MAKPCIGIVYGYQHSKWIGHKTGELFALLKGQFEARGLEVQKVGLMDFRLEVMDGKLSITDLYSGRNLAELAGVYFANWRINPEFAMGLAQLVHRAGKPVVSEEVLHVLPMSKLGQTILLSDQGIPVVDSVFMRNKYWLKLIANAASQTRHIDSVAGSSAPSPYQKYGSVRASSAPCAVLESERQASNGLPFEFPFILKVIGGSMGANNHLVKDTEQLVGILSEEPSRLFVAQPFIPNDFDYRIIVIGNKVRFAMKRQRTSNETHLNNTSQGGVGLLIPLAELAPDIIDLSLKAAAAVGRSSFAGVDIVQHKDNGKLFVLEINKTPQMETGANTHEKVTALVDYFAERSGGE